MLYKFTLFCLFCFSLQSTEQVYLKIPNISQENMIGTNVGIRPYRKTGVRIEAESLNNKLIIHNYGYEGSGLTMAFGGSHEVLDILESKNPSSKTVAILGAGVAGLTTAYDLLALGYEVHLYSDKWNPNLTSNVAAGIWTPFSSYADLLPEKKKLHQRILKTAEERLSRSVQNNPEFEGVKNIYGYVLTDDTQNYSQGDAVTLYFDNGIIKKAQRVKRIGLDGKLFMDDLFRKVKSKGATLHQMHFENLDQISSLPESIIINCLSLGSREIFNDHELMPVRGQLVYYKPQNEIDYFLFQFIPESNFIFLLYPWNDRLILGGVYEYGQEELITTPATIDRILQNAQQILSGE